MNSDIQFKECYIIYINNSLWLISYVN